MLNVDRVDPGKELNIVQLIIIIIIFLSYSQNDLDVPDTLALGNW
jgi:hypothetical protein